MKHLKLFLLFLIAISMISSGCFEEEEVEVTPTPTPVVTETVKPTVVQTTIAPTPTPEKVNYVYKSDVDNYYGFRKVVNTSAGPAPYDVFNRTLTINVGDQVIWINDAEDPEEPLTVISKEGLWDNSSSRMRWRFKQFNHTFTEPGIYEVYIREYPREQHQKIIVNP